MPAKSTPKSTREITHKMVGHVTVQTVDGLWTTREAMAFLKIGRTRLYALIKDGSLPTYSIGTNGDYRFRVNDVKNLLIPLPGTGKFQM